MQVNAPHDQLPTWPPAADAVGLPPLSDGRHVLSHEMGTARTGIDPSKSDSEGGHSFSALLKHYRPISYTAAPHRIDASHLQRRWPSTNVGINTSFGVFFSLDVTYLGVFIFLGGGIRGDLSNIALRWKKYPLLCCVIPTKVGHQRGSSVVTTIPQ